MASSEKFCLRWNDFESNISGSLRELREEKDFFDVTLACEDNQLQAHKVIVSACSPLFRDILRRNPHQHPLVYLKGVKNKELHAVLNFMYQGEVNVAQDDLNTFLSVAEELQVKGLTQGNNAPSPAASRSQSKPTGEAPSKKPRLSAPSHAPAPPPAAQSSYQHQAPVEVADDDIQEVVPVKSEPGGSMDQVAYQEEAGGAVALEDSYQEEGDYYGGYDDGGAGAIDPNTGLPYGGGDGNKEADDLIQSKMSVIQDYHGHKFWQCSECDYRKKSKADVFKHVERRHVEIQVSCHLCSQVYGSRFELKAHMKFKHQY